MKTNLNIFNVKAQLLNNVKIFHRTIIMIYINNGQET
jgi:hypothetical protein